jgi:signal transduction histidine kinase
MKKKKKTMVYFLIIAILLSFGVVMINRLLHNVNPFDIETVVAGFTNLLSALSIYYLFNKILDSNSKKSVAQLKKQLIPSFILSLLATILITLVFYFLGRYIFFLVNGVTNFIIFGMIISLSTGAIISLSAGLFVCCIVFFYATWCQAIEREQTLREENLKYRYITLKTQVNPHFLFNSLNTLSEIVYADAKKADNYIQKLAGIYRYILDHEETGLVPLDKEIEFVRQYFDLQKERDENKIQLDIDLKNADKFQTVPISLQILVENALKHNVISEEKPLKIHINGDDKYISVSNNIQRKSILSHSSGTGLSNLKERVKLITGKEVIINQENNRFTVKLPLIEI